MRFPLKHHLQDPVDEAALQRIAQEIDARVPARRRRRGLPLALAAAAMVGAAIAAFALVHRDPGPLLLADGRVFAAVDAAGTARDISLSDGSRISLSAGARIEPLESSGSVFSAMLTRGRADFDVHPRGPRHWIIECGLATVEVVGTEFACERGPGRLRVAVRRGVVLVRGECVPDRARRISAGETLDVSEDATRLQPAATSTPVREILPDNAGSIAIPNSSSAAGTGGQSQPVPTRIAMGTLNGFPYPPATGSGEQSPPAPTRIASARSWRDLARHGRHGEAFAVLGPDGLQRESKRLGVNDLLVLADVARLSGHPAEAVAPLERILIDFASDAHAPLAAFALGRLELDSLGRAQAAAVALNKALTLGIPRSLREDVRARLVEAYARGGDPGAARRAAAAYFDEFPHGRHTRAIESWLHPR
jgi:transmembrane sensor